MTNFLETLRLLANQINHAKPLQAQLGVILELLAKKHNFLRPHIVLFEPETGILKLRVAQEAPKQNHENYTTGQGITGQVFATGKPAIVPVLSKNPTFSSLLFERSQEELDSLAFICVPIFSHEVSDSPFLPRDVIGTLGIDSPSLGEEDLEIRCKFLEVVADLISIQTTYLQNVSQQNSLTSSKSDVFPNENLAFVTQSKKMKLLLEQANSFAQTNLPVLLYGEKGTGKEFFARRIHSQSAKKSLPFKAFYCQLQSGTHSNDDELLKDFCGYVKNAFPNALQTTKGIFEAAAQGTLYIDSVEKLPLLVQKILLKVLTEGSITRLGSNTPIALNVRIITSTSLSHHEFDELIKTKAFDEELSLRLKFQHTTLPTLRERKEDILPLAEHFLKKDAEEKKYSEVKRISYPAIELLSSYYYSGNIPELKSIIDYAAEHCVDSVIRTTDLPPSIQSSTSVSLENELSLTDAVNNFEKEMIVDALVKANGNMFKAAQALKTSYRIINYKIKKYNLKSKKFNK